MIFELVGLVTRTIRMKFTAESFILDWIELGCRVIFLIIFKNSTYL